MDERLLAKSVEFFMNSEDIVDVRSDLIRAAKQVRILPLLEISSIQITGQPDIRDISDIEVIEVMEHFCPILFEAIVHRQLDGHNDALLHRLTNGLFGKGSDPFGDVVSSLEGKPRTTH